MTKKYQVDVTYERKVYFEVEASSESEAEEIVNQRITGGDEDGEGEYSADTYFEDVYELIEETE